MNKIKKIIILSIILFTITFWINQNISLWYTTNDINLIYDNFYIKLEEKLKNNEKILTILESIDSKLSEILTNKKLSKKNTFLILSLKKSNLEKINKIKNETTKNTLIWKKNEITKKEETYSIRKIDWQKKPSLNKEDIYKLSNLEKYFYNFLDEKEPFFIKDWNYYTYDYKSFMYFNTDSLHLYDLEYYKIDPKTTLLIKQTSWKYVFSKNYEIIKLASQNILEGTTNLKEFLTNLKNDYLFKKIDFEETLKNIKRKTNLLINWLNTDDQKIEAIYTYIINQIDYDLTYISWNNEVYSWIMTFNNSKWVCDWYVKLFLYMLSFAQIEDVEIKRWYKIDNIDFPEFWHAWVKIWDYYYDPTFDDPVWSNRKKSINDFIYYKIPYKLMYTDRFEWYQIPKYLENTSLKERKKIVLKNKYKIFDEFKDFKLLNEVKNRINLWYNYNDEINLENLIKKIPTYNVMKDNIWIYFINNLNEKKYIKSIKYYTIDNKNIELIIESIPDYNDLTILIFDWEYRLVYNLKLYQ